MVRDPPTDRRELAEYMRYSEAHESWFPEPSQVARAAEEEQDEARMRQELWEAAWGEAVDEGADYEMGAEEGENEGEQDANDEGEQDAEDQDME